MKEQYSLKCCDYISRMDVFPVTIKKSSSRKILSASSNCSREIGWNGKKMELESTTFSDVRRYDSTQ